MSTDNPLWGSPRIHGELLKLGFGVAQSSVAKYMIKRSGPSAQGWRTFLHNHAPNSPSFVTEVPGDGLINNPQAVADTRRYVLNLARWLGARAE